MTQPPGSGDLVSQINDLRRQLAEMSRRSPANPACRVKLSAAAGISSGDTWAGANWEPSEDPMGWHTDASPAYITVGLDGFYLISYHSTTTGLAAGAIVASKVSLNAANVTTSVASDLTGVTTASEGAVQDAFRARVPLAAGDRLYWSNYANATGGTLQAVSFGIPTEIVVQFVSSR